MIRNIWLIGAAAGLATFLLFLSSGFATGGTLLGFFVPLPSLIAGIGFGWPVAAIAGLVGAVLFFLLTNGVGGIIYFGIIAVPVTIITYIAGLWNPPGTQQVADSFRQPPPAGDEDKVAWFPLSAILMTLVLMATALAALMSFSLGIDELAYRAAVFEILDDLIDNRLAPILQREFTLDQRVALKETTAKLLPAAVAASWLLLMVLNAWLASKIAQMSGLMQRPAPDIRMTGMPAGVIIGLGIMLFAASFDGPIGRFAMGFVGAGIMAVILIGLAVIHEWSFGRPLRPMLLGGVYLGFLIAVIFTVIPIFLLGLADQFFDFRGKARARRTGRPNPNSEPPPDQKGPPDDPNHHP